MARTAFDKIMDGLDQARQFARREDVPGLLVQSRKVERSEVAAVRIKAGLTQAEFARVLGSSLGTVRKWEAGERNPSGAAATLLRVLDYDAATVARAIGMTPNSPKRLPRSRLVAAE
jgi:putative transcriptional regulator